MKKISCCKKIVTVNVFLVIFGLYCASLSYAVSIGTGDGLFFSQVDLAYTGASQANSAYGQVAVDINQMTANTGISSGFLNIQTSSGWVVRNMPVDSLSGYPGISTVFDIGVGGGTDVSFLDVYADLSSTPTTSFTGGPATAFSVGDVSYNAEGRDGGRTDLPTSSVDATVINFLANGLTDGTWQAGHTSIEQEKGQCGPAAVANSLQWIEDTYKIKIPDPHKAGKGTPPGGSDGSLVGELDERMNRQGPDGVSDNELMDGKLQYLKDKNLGDKIETKHKGRTGGTTLTDDHSNAGITSKADKSNLSLAEWIKHEIDDGEDVEMGVGWKSGGGHWVEITGGGTVLGVPWVSWKHDAFQGAAGGNNWDDGGIGWSPVVGDSLIMYIEGKFDPATLDLVVSESPVPEPSTFILFGLGAVALLGRKSLSKKN